MSLRDLPPEPPAWALAAGVPKPQDEETFAVYVERIGFDACSLLADLTDQTAEIANLRLATCLRIAMPDEYEDFVDALVGDHHTLDDRIRIENAARYLFGDRFRRRQRYASV